MAVPSGSSRRKNQWAGGAHRQRCLLTSPRRLLFCQDPWSEDRRESVCVCVSLCAERFWCTVIIRIHNGFDSGALVQWTQHMPREITGWLTGYLTGWPAPLTAPTRLINPIPSIQTDFALDVSRALELTFLYCIRQDRKSELFVCSQVVINFAAVLLLFKWIQSSREKNMLIL